MKVTFNMSTDNCIGLILSYEPNSPKLADYLRTIPADFYIPGEKGTMSLNVALLRKDIHELDGLLLDIGVIKKSLSFLNWQIVVEGYTLSRILYTDEPLATEYTLLFRMLGRIIPKHNGLRKVIGLTTCNGWTLGELFLGLYDQLSDSIRVC